MTSVTCIYMGSQRPMGACEIYRINMPYVYLSKLKGWKTNWLFFDQLFEQFRRGGLSKTVLDTDLFVIPRAFVRNEIEKIAMQDFIFFLKSHDRKVVYEVDDDFTNRFRTVIDGDALDVMKMCDAITVSTKYLGEEMKALTGLPYYVLPNMLDPNLWRDGQAPVRLTDKILIGLTGSVTHYNDWLVLKDVLPKITEAFNAYVLLGAFHPDYFEGLHNFEKVQALPYPQYTQLIRGCDIVLCPVDPLDRFNDSKSAIKAVEAMGARRKVGNAPGGAVTIATNNHVYAEVIEHTKNGFLVDHTPQMWYDCLQIVLKDFSFMKNMQKTAYKDAWKKYDISQRSSLWAKAYESIINS